MTTPPLLTDEPAANNLLIDSPFALLVGMLLDQQIPMERAFAAPYLLQQRLGEELSPSALLNRDPQEVISHFSQKPALHRFPKSMAERAIVLSQIVQDTYGGKPESIWDDGADATTVLKRIGDLPGFGVQKAKIFLALLAKRYGVQPVGWREVTAPFGEANSYYSVADIDSKEAFAKVRAHKAEMKAAKHT